ncbi:MAG: hypothetical protein ACPHSD_01485 [Candidatus Latescibacterota bacterium]
MQNALVLIVLSFAFSSESVARERALLSLYESSDSSSDLMEQTHALDALLGRVQIGGFADIYNERSAQSRLAGQYRVGQVEVGLSADLSSRVGIEAAVARDGSAPALAVLVADFRLVDSGDVQSALGVESLNVLVGRFDVPFGIDWHVYPSIDRLLVSGPLVVDGTHGGWNDLGVQAYAEAGRFDLVGYAVRGADIDAAEWAAGTRVGVRSGDAALGLSLAGLHDGSGLPNRHLLGADIQWSFNSLSAKAEYVRRWPAARSQDGVQHGAYAQGTWENQRYFAVVRLGALETADGDEQRLSVGGGWRMRENCQLRMEFQANSAAREVLFTQLVVGF